MFLTFGGIFWPTPWFLGLLLVMIVVVLVERKRLTYALLILVEVNMVRVVDCHCQWLLPVLVVVLRNFCRFLEGDNVDIVYGDFW